MVQAATRFALRHHAWLFNHSWVLEPPALPSGVRTGSNDVRVLFVTPSLPVGGSERVITRLADALPSSFHSHVFIFHKEVKLMPNCEVVAMNSPMTIGLVGGILSTFRRAIALRKVVGRIQPDVIVSFQSAANLAVFLFLTLGGTKYLQRCVFGLTYDPFESSRQEPLLSYRVLASTARLSAFLLTRVGYVLVASDTLKRKLDSGLRSMDRRIIAIRYFCDRARLKVLGAEEVVNWPADPVIISVARLNPQKNQSMLLRAFASVRRTVRCKLVLVGGGESEQSLRDLTRRLGIESEVIFLGVQINPYRFVSRSKVFVLPSLYEGMPNILFEAIALGVPVVATDTGGSMEIVGSSSQYGMIVPKNDEAELARRLLQMLTDENLHEYYSKMALVRSREFDVDVVLPKYADLFRRLGGRSRAE